MSFIRRVEPQRVTGSGNEPVMGVKLRRIVIVASTTTNRAAAASSAATALRSASTRQQRAKPLSLLATVRLSGGWLQCD
jgi:hypothetical protein